MVLSIVIKFFSMLRKVASLHPRRDARLMKTTHVFITALLYGALPFLCGCGTFAARSHHRTTSVIQFLYPNKAEHVEAPSVPTLSLPLKVGVAFVPLEHSKTRPGNHFPISDATVNEAQKLELMKAVSQHFKQHAFVKSIQLIPSAYLTPGGSFDNLDQLRSM